MEQSQVFEWYFEYKIQKNRPGLLGDIASMLGMLSINIISINGVENEGRGLLIQSDSIKKINSLSGILENIDSITISAFRPPTIMDRLAVRHGRYIERCIEQNCTFKFTREELGLLVDFLGELFKKDGHMMIGVRGMPRVGKTESIVAGSVCANKRWTFVSSTLLRQTVRNQLAEDESSDENVFIIDGIVSTLRANETHRDLLREIIRRKSTKVIEHPDIFVRETEFTLDDFDYIIELRNDPDEEINYNIINTGFSDFSIS